MTFTAPVFMDIADEVQLRTLLFSNPVFHEGINVTCRNGYKWADAMGELAHIRDTNGMTDYGYGHILGVMTVCLNKIPECVLSLEHDPSCQTVEGIIAEMKRIYGDDLKEDAPTTVLFFEMKNEI